MTTGEPLPWMHRGTSFGGIISSRTDGGDSSPPSERHCREGGVDVELAQDALDVGADGVWRDAQLRTNLVAGQSFHQAAQHVELSHREERDGIGLGCG